MILWIKAFHIIVVVTWFAGLFYLPRLFVYHAMTNAQQEPAAYDRFLVMERKLYNMIIMPSAILVTISGLWLSHVVYNFQPLWLHVKTFLVVILWIYQLYCRWIYTQFLNHGNRRTHVWFRWFNEVPTVILLLGIYLVVLRPW